MRKEADFRLWHRQWSFPEGMSAHSRRLHEFITRVFAMGTSTDAHCFDCGYDVFLVIGSGFRGDRTLWPSHCKGCQSIVSVNVDAPTKRCPECRSRRVVELEPEVDQSAEKAEPAVSWGHRNLSETNYVCPKCERQSLRFGTNRGNHAHLLWD